MPNVDLRASARAALRELEATDVTAPEDLARPGRRVDAGEGSGAPVVLWEFSTLLALRFEWTAEGARAVELIPRTGG